MNNAAQKKSTTEEKIEQLEQELKGLQAKTKEELKISPENEQKIRELDDKRQDVEMEAKELNEKVENAIAINKDLENQ